MKTLISILLIVFCFNTSNAQVGIGTTNPQGALDIISTNMGLVLPRVSSFEVLTDGNGNPPVNGTMVYDLAREKVCMKTNGR